MDAVVPLVRLDADRRTAAGDPSSPLTDFLVGSLVVLYAFDEDDQFSAVATRDLVRLGVDQAGLATAALDNLLDRLGELQILERPDGCGMVRLDGNLESSTLVVPQLWRDIGGILGDEVLVAVPAKDVVLFCGAGDQSSRLALLAARDRALAVGDHQMSTDLLRFCAGTWQVEPG